MSHRNFSSNDSLEICSIEICEKNGKNVVIVLEEFHSCLIGFFRLRSVSAVGTSFESF
jgi:hypothetical protein